MKPWFADSFYYFALLNPADEAHAKALAASRDPRRPVVTTAWVLTEVADGFAGVEARVGWAQYWRKLRAASHVKIIPATMEWFNRGMERYQARRDKEWSLTDCISFLAMEDHGLLEALTGDAHFEQAGFTALLK